MRQLREEYDVLEEIGIGSFATVYRARHKQSGSVVAIKAVHTRRLGNQKLWANLKQEIKAMRRIDSPHIVKLTDLLQTEKYVYLVMEYCDRGDLFGLLQKNRHGLPEETVRLIMRQLREAMRELHRYGLVHRDLKPQNILLSSNASLGKSSLPEGDLFIDDTAVSVKVADLGFVRLIDNDQEQAETMCGSPLYMAPEVLCYEKYDQKADLWSLGAIMHELLFGTPPYRADNHIALARLLERSPPFELPSAPLVSADCGDLLRRLLQKSPQKRISFKDLFEHPFLSDTPITPSLDIKTEPKPIAAHSVGPSLLTQSLSRRASLDVASLAQSPITAKSRARSQSSGTLDCGDSMASGNSSMTASVQLLNNRVFRVSWEEELIDLAPVECRLALQRAMLWSDAALEANTVGMLLTAASALMELRKMPRLPEYPQLWQSALKKAGHIYGRLQRAPPGENGRESIEELVTAYAYGLALEAGFKDLLGYPNVWRVYYRLDQVLTVETLEDKQNDIKTLLELLRERTP